jgi:hypothetical protein
MFGFNRIKFVPHPQRNYIQWLKILWKTAYDFGMLATNEKKD